MVPVFTIYIAKNHLHQCTEKQNCKQWRGGVFWGGGGLTGKATLKLIMYSRVSERIKFKHAISVLKNIKQNEK